MKIRQFVVKDCAANEDLGLTPGDVVMEYLGFDYGMQGDHERIAGEPHINVSIDGGVPFFCVPARNLEAA